MQGKTILALGMVGLATVVTGAGLWFLGTFTWRSRAGETPASRGAGSAGTGGSFASDYQAARDRFLDAARAAGATVESYRNPHPGPDGQPLVTDVALIGPPDARTVLVLSSGTHGVEGFAGSGIQTGLLREGIASRLPPGVRLVMIHAINPYGMAYLRRFTEENVDLNRNFRDHARPAPPNPGYDRLASAIAPPSLGFWSEVRAWARLLWFRVTAGAVGSQEAVQGGQYAHPTGIFFGGTSAAWANRTVRGIVRQHVSTTTAVVVVDVHTGLGAYGNAELIMNVPTTTPEYGRAVAIWGPGRVRSTVTGESVSAHLDASLKLAFADMLPEAEVTAASLEFGTLPPMEVFKALRAENWLHHHGEQGHPRTAAIKRRLLRVFHPDDPGWEEQVWMAGQGVVGDVLHWVAQSPGQEAQRGSGSEPGSASSEAWNSPGSQPLPAGAPTLSIRQQRGLLAVLEHVLLYARAWVSTSQPPHNGMSAERCGELNELFNLVHNIPGLLEGTADGRFDEQWFRGALKTFDRKSGTHFDTVYDEAYSARK